MRVLHFITALEVGGAQTAKCNLLEYWQRTGVNNIVEHHVAYVHKEALVNRLKRLNIPVYKVRGSVFRYDPVILYRFYKLVKKLKPDIIHSSLWSANIISSFFRIISKKFNIPIICDLHNNCYYDGKVRNFLSRRVLSGPDRFIAVSDSVLNSFHKVFGKNKNLFEKSVVIRNGIDSRLLQSLAAKDSVLREDIGIDNLDFVIGTVGRLDKVKRYDLLISAFELFVNNLPKVNSRLVIVGDGPEMDNLKKLSKSLKIENKVNFVGFSEKVYRYYPIFDCFVLSSKTEGLSIALLEAMSFGLPIITTCDESGHDVISNRKRGLTVKISKNINYQDIKTGLYEAFKNIYGNTELVNKIRERNLFDVETEFHISNVADRYFDIYESLT